MADNNICEHKMCRCAALAEDEFCSDHCREATEQEMAEIACDCGHPTCG